MNTVTLLSTVLYVYAAIISELCKAQAPFMLVDTRPQGALNVVTLRCRASDGQFATQVMYFRNGTDVETIDGFSNLNSEQGVVTFNMARSFEGEYSCGTQNQMSDPVPLIAFPDQAIIQSRQPTYAVVGDTIILQCGIQPGALVAQYYATWFNRSLALHQYLPLSQRLRNPTPDTSLTSRYSINPDDLSLIIRNVKLSDALVNYRCEIGVEDPRTDLRYVYPQSRSYNIGLEVVAPPQIITELPPNTVVSNNQDVVFVCSAEGYPAPIISWWHGGREVTGEMTHFKTNFTVRPSSNGRGSNITKSYFTITSVNTSMDGEVRCKADPPAPETIGGLEVSADSTSTQLTTLGPFKGLKVQVTTGGDVIIIVSLQRAMVVPVHLNLIFTDLDNPTREDTRVTQAAYLNITEIQHVVFSSLVAFNRFVIEVGLFAQDVYGPVTMALGEYDKNSPTVFDEGFSTEKMIVICASGVAVVFIICIVVGTVVCTVQFKNARLSKAMHKQELDKQELDNSKDKKIRELEKELSESNHKFALKMTIVDMSVGCALGILKDVIETNKQDEKAKNDVKDKNEKTKNDKQDKKAKNDVTISVIEIAIRELTKIGPEEGTDYHVTKIGPQEDTDFHVTKSGPEEGTDYYDGPINSGERNGGNEHDEDNPTTEHLLQRIDKVNPDLAKKIRDRLKNEIEDGIQIMDTPM